MMSGPENEVAAALQASSRYRVRAGQVLLAAVVAGSGYLFVSGLARFRDASESYRTEVPSTTLPQTELPEALSIENQLQIVAAFKSEK